MNSIIERFGLEELLLDVSAVVRVDRFFGLLFFRALDLFGAVEVRGLLRRVLLDALRMRELRAGLRPERSDFRLLLRDLLRAPRKVLAGGGRRRPLPRRIRGRAQRRRGVA